MERPLNTEAAVLSEAIVNAGLYNKLSGPNTVNEQAFYPGFVCMMKARRLGASYP